MLYFELIFYSNIFVLKDGNFFYIFNLTKFFFILNFAIEKDNLKFLYIETDKYLNFFRNFFKFYMSIKKIFFFRLKLKGLGYSVRRFSKYLFSFFMAVSNRFYFHIPLNIFVKKRKKLFIFLSYNEIKLNTLFWNLLFLKKHNVYVRARYLSGFIKPNYLRLIKKKNKLKKLKFIYGI